jgi:hypothetical protein
VRMGRTRFVETLVRMGHRWGFFIFCGWDIDGTHPFCCEDGTQMGLVHSVVRMGH